jgi:hypothetical protein
VSPLTRLFAYANGPDHSLPTSPLWTFLRRFYPTIAPVHTNQLSTKLGKTKDIAKLDNELEGVVLAAFADDMDLYQRARRLSPNDASV